ncbi:MAG: HsdR family type I site-specific deoxyribonuclease [Prevotella sp.]|nr:HsdR family type I site-specific deoxyribonuclease [Staphylococcus sp.]MCM1349570.1 HsdR family type I site-specific deoxyribonuclease [Prevotella sp.]
MEYIFEKGTFTESDLEHAIIQLFEQEGYNYVYGDDIHRKLEDIILVDDLRSFICNKYVSANLTTTEINTIINRVIDVGSSASLYAKNKEAFYLITEGFDLVREDITQVGIHIDFIDFDNFKNNVYKVVNQYSVKGSSVRRPDLIVFINGIPVCICEFKTAVKEDTTIYDAWKQVTIRYTRDIENLMKYCFLAVISDGANNRLGSIFTPYEFFYAWNKVNDNEKVSNGISSLLSLIKGAFAKERVLAILRDFVYYPEIEGKEQEIVCRYPQFFGANSMVENVKKHLKPLSDGKGGTYFGATGCGKTYTMLFMTKLLMQRYASVFHNPTIIIITDREDLNNQARDVFAGAKRYLHDDDIRAFESRQDLNETLLAKESGGVYITTIQKFCESTGLLSNRSNIICISDEAHRTQIEKNGIVKRTDEGIIDSKSFAQYLKASLPNATRVGFTGTPIDETIAVFGDIVDQYTMKESSDDGITVRIAYEPRLARVIVSDEQAREIEEYYRQCEFEGSTDDQIQASKRAMSNISAILGHPDVLKKLARDIVTHYEHLCAEKPEVLQKGMIVCPDRPLAYALYKEIIAIRPEWAVAKKCEGESLLTKDELDELTDIPFINLVATQGQDDPKPLYNLCGTKEYRQKLDKLFKNDKSNFKLAIVVDMWITGFDVPSLAVMYINKPLKRHTLIQTISRVNRVFEGKDKGLIVDYIGIKNSMMEAIKIYGSPQESPVDEIRLSIEIFRNHLSLIDELMKDFNATKFYVGDPLERLLCLNAAAEYVQLNKEMQDRFMSLTRKLRAAYNICFPTGELKDEEIKKAQFFLAVRSIIYKQTKGDAPDTETMNRIVEEMVKKALACTGVENIMDNNKEIDIFSEEFLAELKKVKMPITKFNALLKLLRQAISNYGHVNKVKAQEFSEMLKNVVARYNTRDKLIFTSEVVADFVDDLSTELMNILNLLKEDKTSFEKMGITFEEKAFYDILVKVRDTHNFPYADEKCLVLAKEIKKLVDDKAQYADWSTRDDIKSQLNMDLIVLLYENGYPPEWNAEVYEKVLEQAENFKKFSD